MDALITSQKASFGDAPEHRHTHEILKLIYYPMRATCESALEGEKEKPTCLLHLIHQGIDLFSAL